MDFSIQGHTPAHLYKIGDKNLTSAAEFYTKVEDAVNGGKEIPAYELLGALRYCINATSAYRNAAVGLFQQNEQIPSADSTNNTWVV